MYNQTRSIQRVVRYEGTAVSGSTRYFNKFAPQHGDACAKLKQVLPSCQDSSRSRSGMLSQLTPYLVLTITIASDQTTLSTRAVMRRVAIDHYVWLLGCKATLTSVKVFGWSLISRMSTISSANLTRGSMGRDIVGDGTIISCRADSPRSSRVCYAFTPGRSFRREPAQHHHQLTHNNNVPLRRTVRRSGTAVYHATSTMDSLSLRASSPPSPRPARP
jgi:hypothetical protein